ncbi:MAG TPA: AI-2E family transporter, partial [Candidatus Paceibacterota bacterium]
MNRRNAQIFFFLSLLIISIVISFFIVRPFISTLILAIVAAVVFYPIHKMFYKFFKAKWLAATLTILIFFSTILAPMSFFGVRVVEEAQTAYRYFTETIDGIVLISNVESFINKNIFERFLNIEQETEGSFFLDFNSYVQDVFNWLVRNFGAVASGLARVGINLMLFIFAMFFLLRDGEGIKKFIVGLSPLDDKYDEEIFKRLSKSINSVIRGSLMIAVIQGILAGVGFTLFGIPSPILWAGAVMVAALVPALGTA